jgi:hypothetical protein
VRLALRVQQDVSRFQIAMENAALMRVMNGSGDSRHQSSGFPHIVAADVRRLRLSLGFSTVRSGAAIEFLIGTATEDGRISGFGFFRLNLLTSLAAIDSLGERPTFDEPHAEVMMAILLANFVDRHDVWMIQVGCGFSFGTETFNQCGGGQVASGDHLDRDNPIQANLARFEDDPHPAPRDFLDQFVVTNPPNGLRRLSR